MQVEPWGVFQQPLHTELVGFFVALGARRAGAGAFAGIEHAPLDGGGIGIERHGSAEGVDFANHVTLGETANGGVAAHLSDGVEILRKHGDRATESGGSKGSFDSGVAGTDDEHVIIFRVNKHGQSGAQRSMGSTERPLNYS